MEQDYDPEDALRAFLVILQGMVQKNGLMMADEGHYKSMTENAAGLAVSAAKTMARWRWKKAAK